MTDGRGRGKTRVYRFSVGRIALRPITAAASARADSQKSFPRRADCPAGRFARFRIRSFAAAADASRARRRKRRTDRRRFETVATKSRAYSAVDSRFHSMIKHESAPFRPRSSDVFLRKKKKKKTRLSVFAANSDAYSAFFRIRFADRKSDWSCGVAFLSSG